MDYRKGVLYMLSVYMRKLMVLVLLPAVLLSGCNEVLLDTGGGQDPDTGGEQEPAFLLAQHPSDEIDYIIAESATGNYITFHSATEEDPPSFSIVDENGPTIFILDPFTRLPIRIVTETMVANLDYDLLSDPQTVQVTSITIADGQPVGELQTLPPLELNPESPQANVQFNVAYSANSLDNFQAGIRGVFASHQETLSKASKVLVVVGTAAAVAVPGATVVGAAAAGAGIALAAKQFIEVE